jgi:hypothetical protein
VIEQRLRTALTAAMRARDTVAVSALRSAVAALDNATAVPPSLDSGPGSAHVAGSAVGAGAVGAGAAEAPRREPTEAEAEALVRAEIADRLAAAETYGAGAAADRLRTEASHLAAILGGLAG